MFKHLLDITHARGDFLVTLLHISLLDVAGSRAGLQLFGRDGQSLTDKWAEGVRTLHGMHVHGFPNCFLMNNAQAGFTASYPHMLNEQAKHRAYIIQTATERGLEAVEVSEQGEADWVQQCIDKARLAGEFFESCTPGYYNNEGKPDQRRLQDSNYGAGAPAFFSLLESWRDAGDMAGLDLS